MTCITLTTVQVVKMITPGSNIELSYPTSTLVDALARFALRRIRVYRIRDLLADPLTPEEFLRRPYIRRSRWLISGYDLDKGQYRKFYLGSSAEHRAPGLLKVAFYEPGATRPTIPYLRPFGPSRSERRVLIDIVRDCTQRDLHDLQLRVYCDDLNVHRPPPSPLPPPHHARVIRFAG